MGRPTLIALAAMTAACLLLETALVRILSLSLWHPFAHSVVGIALIGFGLGARLLWSKHRLRELPTQTILERSALGFTASCCLGYPLWNFLPLEPMALLSSPIQFFWMALLVVFLALPFGCVGVFVTRLFMDHPTGSARLYAADLLGAAGGVVLYAILTPWVGAPAALYIAGALGLVAALQVGLDSFHVRNGTALAFVLIMGASAYIEQFLPVRVTPNKPLGEGQVVSRLPRTWSVSSAVDVIQYQETITLAVDGGATLSYVPNSRTRGRTEHPPPPKGLEAIPYALTEGRDVLVVGAGGGMDTYAAVGAGATRVLALEVDSATNELVRGELSAYVGGLYGRPEVTLETAEARAYLAALDPKERFDVIVAHHPNTNAASVGGPLSMVENYLHTVEGVSALLDRLSDRGVLVLSRPEQHMGRIAATVGEAWRSRKLSDDVTEHVAVGTISRHAPNFISQMVVSRVPFGEDALAKYKSLVPGRVAYVPPLGTGLRGDKQSYYSAALRGEPAPPSTFPAASLTPTTDDRPFFNLYGGWLGSGAWNDVLAADSRARAAMEEAPVSQIAVFITFMGVALAFLFMVVVPRFRRPSEARATLRRVFLPLGLGYIVVELVLIQMLTRMVGEPGWALVLALGGFLAGSGASSALLVGRHGWNLARAGACAGAGTIVLAVVCPWVMDVLAPTPFALRSTAALVIAGAAGLFLGAPTASTLQALSQLEGEERSSAMSWAWTLLSIGAAWGTGVMLLLASSLGFRFTLIMMGTLYALCGWTAVAPNKAQGEPTSVT